MEAQWLAEFIKWQYQTEKVILLINLIFWQGKKTSRSQTVVVYNQEVLGNQKTEAWL